MKRKIATSLVFLVLLAQLSYLVFALCKANHDLAVAPRIIVHTTANLPYSIFSSSDRIYLNRANEMRLGRSLWWSSEPWITAYKKKHRDHDDAEPPDCVSRPAPDEKEVQGSIELKPDSEDIKLSVIWRRGEDGMWSYRLEAPGSSEDVLREGELRSPKVRCWPMSWYSAVCVDLFGYDTYDMTANGRNILETWKTNHEREAETLQRNGVTVEVALREKAQPMVTRIFLNGIPLQEALKMMKTDTFPSENPKIISTEHDDENRTR